MHRNQRGITLIELMIVVAIIGILAGIAVFMFGGTTKKAKAKTEVSAVFAEFQIRQQEFYTENNVYLSTGADEGDMFPAAPSRDGATQSLSNARPTSWTDLRFQSDKDGVLCAYVAIAGEGGDDTNVGPIASGDFNFTAPELDWYYLLAQCDMDQDDSVDSFYFARSDTEGVFFVNQGK